VKRSCCILLAVVLLVLAGVFVGGVAWVRSSGLSARPEPSSLEVRLARMARAVAVDFAAKRAPNPVPASPEALVEGRAHYADHCALCHANDGSGDTALGRRLYPRAPDMRRSATQDLTDGELFHVIENGVRLTGMPGWGGEVPTEASWKLVHFIRHLPRITPEEILDMERLNPKSPREWREMQEDEQFLGGEPAKPPAVPHHRAR